MSYFPINLDIAGRKVLVVGGGRVALRKVRSLAACGARVVVVSPAVCAALGRMEDIRLARRRYRKRDLRGACLVVSATDSEAVNRRVYEQATALKLPVNVVDQPELCTFTVPAMIRRKDLLITVSTAGGSPALSRRLRRKLEEELGPALAEHVALLKQLRPAIQSSTLGVRERARLFTQMAGEKVTRTLKARGKSAARRLLRRMLSAALAKRSQP